MKQLPTQHKRLGLEEGQRTLFIPFSVRVLLVGTLILFVCWSFAIPIFEAPDEQDHWQYARYIHDTWQLPYYDSRFVEANSPPLYYMLIAPVAVPSDKPPPLTWNDPYGQMIEPVSPWFFQNSYNDFRTYWPIRIARLLSALISLGTVLICYFVGYEATGRVSTGVLTAGLIAFLPQFTFRSMNVSNDVLVTAMSAGACYLTVRTLRRGFQWNVALAAAVVLAGAFLSKISAIFLPVPLALVMLAERGHWSVRAKRLTVFAVTLLLVAPWCYRNYVLYGDLFASKAMLTAVAYLVDPKPLSSPYFLTDFPYDLIRSTIGVFGMMRLYMSESMYWLYFLFFGIAAGGLVWGLIKGTVSRPLVALLLCYPLLNLLIVININLTFSQAQGRYMFPALPAMMLLAALGLESVLHWPAERQRLVLSGLALTNAIILYVVAGAYWPPPIDTLAQPPLPLPKIELQNVVSSQQNVFVIGAAPARFVLPVMADATDYAFVRFTIRGSADNPDLLGAVSFRGENGVVTNAQIPFRWRGDGQEYVITVPVFQDPGWRGRVSALYIDPVADTDSDQRAGMTLSLYDVRLTGNLR